MSKRGPRPHPDNVRHLRDEYKDAPDREEIKPEPITPKMPTNMSKLGKQNWKYLAPELEQHALLTKRDREAFRFLCEDAAIAQGALLAMMDDKKNLDLLNEDPNHNNRLRRHPALIIYNQATNSYRRWCQEFGLTPAGRVNLPIGGGLLPPIAQDDDDDADDSELFG